LFTAGAILGTHKVGHVEASENISFSFCIQLSLSKTVVLGALDPADDSYSRAIDLCRENLLETANQGFGTRRCDDLYVLLLNRGSLRLNNGRAKEALADLSQSSVLRGRPDAIVAQNLARAKELNGMYAAADSDYNLAISMTANEVSPFWLRSALVKFQLGDVKGGFDLLKRVENRFPEAPEVRAAYASFLAATGKQIEAQRKFLDIPDRQRMNYFNDEFLRETVSWPPVVIEALAKVTSAVEKPINKS
jgi:tetratricopeptide (TPR) repeat protein